jgi:hypothetical protein
MDYAKPSNVLASVDASLKKLALNMFVMPTGMPAKPVAEVSQVAVQAAE